MRWLSNILPAERNLYVGMASVVVLVIAAFIATSMM
jgi:hypothetical protein